MAPRSVAADAFQQTLAELGVDERDPEIGDARALGRRVLALPTDHGDLAYPAFQFDEKGEPYREIAVVLEAFAPANLTAHTIASWFVTPQRSLRGRTRASWMAAGAEPDDLREAARRSAAAASAR